MTGGALPVRGGLVLSTERMTRISTSDADDRLAVVEPGVINADLQAAVEARGLFYAPDPASLGMCSMGGNVAENAGGPRAFKYGVTRDWTLGMTSTLMGGETLRLGRRRPRGVTGYDLTALFVGSEGTFGVTSEITVQLVGRPRRRHAHRRHARRGVARAAPSAPSSARATGRARWSCSTARRSITCAPRRPSRSRRTRARSCWSSWTASPRAWRRILRCGGRVRGRGAPRRDHRARRRRPRRLWSTRALLALRCARRTPSRLSEDIVVPPGSIAEMLRGRRASPRKDCTTATFGHAGDGNLHVNVLTDENHRDAAVAARIQSGAGRRVPRALDLGGTLSGEHGIGIAKAQYMAWEQSAEVIDWQKRLKRMWDPA
jgi:glycolate oxidase